MRLLKQNHWITEHDKLHWTLKTKTRVTGIIYNLGDIVYYKRKDSEKWKGPSKENKQHFVKHSGYYIWVYPISLQLIHRDNEDCEGENYINNNVEKLTEMTI